jgi:hypothetical protein
MASARGVAKAVCEVGGRGDVGRGLGGGFGDAGRRRRWATGRKRARAVGDGGTASRVGECEGRTRVLRDSGFLVLYTVGT